MNRNDRIEILEHEVSVHRDDIHAQADLTQGFSKRCTNLFDWVTGLSGDVKNLMQFQSKIESYPKIFILPCKKCGHNTLQAPTGADSYCLSCGTTWRKRIRETIEEVK
jgi:ribosomal protein L37E